MTTKEQADKEANDREAAAKAEKEANAKRASKKEEAPQVSATTKSEMSAGAEALAGGAAPPPSMEPVEQVRYASLDEARAAKKAEAEAAAANPPK